MFPNSAKPLLMGMVLSVDKPLAARFPQLRFTGYDHQDQQEKTPDEENDAATAAAGSSDGDEYGITEDRQDDSDGAGSHDGRQVTSVSLFGRDGVWQGGQSTGW